MYVTPRPRVERQAGRSIVSEQTINTEALIRSEPAFQGDLAPIGALATDFGNADAEATFHAEGLVALSRSFDGDQDGPNTDFIVETALEIGQAARRFTAGYSKIKARLATAYDQLEALKSKSDTNWQAIGAYAASADTDTDTGVDEEATTLGSDWDKIRDQEDEIYRALAVEFDELNPGDPATVDDVEIERLFALGIDALRSSNDPTSKELLDRLVEEQARLEIAMSSGTDVAEELSQYDALLEKGVSAEDAITLIEAPDDVVDAVVAGDLDVESATQIAKLTWGERANIIKSDLDPGTILNVLEGDYGQPTLDALLAGTTATQDDFDQLDKQPPAVLFGVTTGELTVEEAADVELPQQQLDDTKSNLGDDWRGVTEGDVNRIRDRMRDMDAWEAEWVFSQLSDSEIETLIDNVEGSGWFSNDWGSDTQNGFYVIVGEKVSLDTWRRLAEHSDQIDPPPSTALPDSARDDPVSVEAFEKLEYRPWLGPLHEGGPSPSGENPYARNDPKQGGLGDCYFIAAMIAVADNDPGALEKMITTNANGTYTVTFGDGSKQVVSADFPVDPTTGDPKFARPGPGSESDEMWFMLLEKAYAQRAGGWGEISGGSQSKAVEDLTGLDSDWIGNGDIKMDDLEERFERGEILGLATIDRPDDITGEEWKKDPDTPNTFKPNGSSDPKLAQNHAYVIVDVDPKAGTVSVLNPWYPHRAPIVLTEAELKDSAEGLYQNDPPGS